MGGGPPARRPRRELRSARRLEARPGPATAHGHRSLALARGMGPWPRRRAPRPPPALPASLSERNIAPAGRPTAWLTSSVKEMSPLLAQNGQILHFSACRGEEYFTTPHNTSRRGGFSFTPAPPLPHRRDKIHPARLHQRPDGTKIAQHAQNAPKRAISGEQGEFCTGSGPAQLEQGEFCTGSGTERSLVASVALASTPPVSPVVDLPPPTRTAARPSSPSGAHRTGTGGGFAPLGALWRRVIGVSSF